MPLSLTAFLSRRVAASGAAAALVYDEQPVTYADLAAESRRVARGLADLGVGAGDRVALWLPNVPAWLACFFACAQLGAIVVTVNTRFKSNEVADIVGRSGAKVLVLWPDFRHIDFAGILRDMPPAALAKLTAFVAYDESADTIAHPPLLGRPVTRYRDLASRPALDTDGATPETGCIIFTTSGTTRAPKFVLHAQASLTHHAGDMARAFGFDAADAAILLTIPLCGVMGLCTATAAFAAGRPLVMLPTFEARAAAQAIRGHGITHFPWLSQTDEYSYRLSPPIRTASPTNFGTFAQTSATLDAKDEDDVLSDNFLSTLDPDEIARNYQYWESRS